MNGTLSKSALVLATIFLLGSVLAVPVVSAEGAQAPIWNEGDSWAMGKSVDLDQEFADQLNGLELVLENAPNATVNEFNVQALASAWILFKVADVTTSEYNLQGQFAAKFAGEAHISVTMDMSKPGTYDWYAIPTEPRTVAVDLTVDSAMVVDATVILQKDTAAVKSIQVDMMASALVEVYLTNIPEMTTSEGMTTIVYHDYHVKLTFDFHMTIHIAFDPSLDIFQFPINVGEEWDVNSNVTLTGTVGGFLDINGLPAEAEEEFFQNEVLQDANITSFPIDFAKIIKSDDPPISNGEIGPVTGEINAHMSCVSSETVTLPLHGLVTIYKILVNDSSNAIYYSDDTHFLTSIEASSSDLVITVLPFELPLSDQMMQMDEVAPNTAEQQINEVSDYRSTIAGEVDGESSPFASFMLLAMILAAVLVIAIVLAFLLIRKK